jgi:DNA mismatch repair protein MutL
MALITTPKKIEILPEHIIDQIKAGEVLERPASLLKELIENSLDAGSTEINLHLIENGMDLLSIEDNGHGMNFDNLPYAFLRHATSKLKKFEDLYRLHSFGFRGEALASVASSARLTCTTQPLDLNEKGGKIVINGGATELLIEQQSDTNGTAIYIKDLFYNTPARLKFIKSKVGEKSAIKKMIYSFVLAHPQVTFTIKWDDKEKEIFKATHSDTEAERIAQVFFGKKSETNRVIFTQQDYEDYRVRVYFTPETYTSPQYRHHYLYVNKRFFQDKSLHQAVLRNLDPYWRFGESGHYLVEITSPASDIDVNVHPNKTQIKFLRSDVVYSLLVTSLKSAIKNRQVATSAQEDLSFSQNGASAPGFFSREENQSFDLLNMGNSTKERSFSVSYYNESTASMTQETRFQRVQNEFMLVKNNFNYEILNLKRMLTSYFSEEFLEFQKNEETPGPLLISEPFKLSKGKIDNYFESMKSLGFEFDRLNSEYIVLRTIPRFLPQAMLARVSEVVINYFNHPKISEFDSTSFKKFLEENFNESLLNDIPEALIEKILDNAPDNSTYKIELTHERLKSLFK